MENQDWEKIKDVFAQALELPVNRRADFLRQACDNNAALQAEVESLLLAHEETEHFIEQQEFAAASAFGANGASYAGRQFGNYKIIREIGRGGMGAVFLAERVDGEFDQRVALKIMRQTFADAELERRFRLERQILASLNHPNIAKLLDGGISQTGEPFLAMEYVEGEPLLDFAEKQNLDVEDRLKLFLKVCSAVSYAHHNLIIHRDIKPSNILVDASGEPKLLDFGLAKIFSENPLDTSQTETAFRAFTPAYASPEQMHGKNITTASDVFSLGVVFYELLTGERPFHFENKSYEEILRSINTLDPPPPSSVVGNSSTGGHLQTKKNYDPTQKRNESQTNGGKDDSKFKIQNPKSLRGDLDTIALMALRKEPERRYQSVEQFARDIERHLNGLPITARPQTAAYRASKFIQRNKIAVSAVGLVILSLAAGLAIALWQANIARQQRIIAEKRFSDVRQLSNALLNDIAPKIERLEGSTEARQALVAQSLKYLDSLAVESADDLTLQAELATAYEKVGVLQGDSRKPSLNDFRGAIVSLEKAQKIRRRLLEINSKDAENRRLLADNLRLLGIRRMTQSDVEGGLRDGKEAVSIYEKLVAENPGSLALRTAYLETRVEDAVGYSDLSRFTEAVPLLEQAASEIEAVRRANPDDAEIQRVLAKCLAYLGYALSWESRQAQAEAKMTEAVSLTESLAARYPNDANHKQNLWTIYQIAAGIYEEIDYARMFELSEKARQVAEEIVAADGANAVGKHNLARTYARLSTPAANLGKPDEAVVYLEKAEAIYSELRDKDPLNRGYDGEAGGLYKRIGDVRNQQRDFSAAIAAYQKGAALYEKKIENDAADTNSLSNLARTYAGIGSVHKAYVETAAGREARQTHLAAAKENYRRALDLMLKAQAQKALAEFDLKAIDQLRTIIEGLEKAG